MEEEPGCGMSHTRLPNNAYQEKLAVLLLFSNTSLAA